jgi:hypothetical protein
MPAGVVSLPDVRLTLRTVEPVPAYTDPAA